MKYILQRTFNIGLVGFLASLVMFLFIYLGINVTGMAPFNVPPSSAFLYNLGIEQSGYALLLHFCYGTFWAYVLVYTFEDDVSILKAVALAIVLWLFMMVVYSPLIGWGFFGFGYAHNLPAGHSLHLDGAVSYISITLAVHLIYGLTLGYLHSSWLQNNG
ncbi:MAG: hypothetical protein U5J63_13600 [Fodinibius sp.]|nr:hypothetical protein [Fodinibius sp.]